MRETAFLDAVFALGDRASRVRRNVVIAIITILSLAVTGSVIAIVQIRAAEQEASTRADEARRAKQDVEREAERARALTEQALEASRVAEESLAQTKAAQSERAAAQSIATERGKTIELTKDQLESALAVAEREKKVAQEQERKARDAARLAEEAAERERKATEEARALYLKEKQRADAADKQRAKITNDLPK